MANTPPARNTGPGAPTKATDTPVKAPGVVDGDGIVRFDGSIVKVDADGNDVLSDHLMPGERLRREDTDRYSAVRATPPDADKVAVKRDDTNDDK